MADMPQSAFFRARLWMVRHARVPGSEGHCYGASDWPAHGPETQMAAQQLVRAWQMQGVRPGRLVVSQRQRAGALALALQGHWPDVPLQVDPRLNEFDFGCWEGVSWADIPKSALDAWTADFAHHRFGGVDCTADLVTRVAAALRELEAVDAPGETLWVTHAGVIRAVQWLFTHGPSAPLVASQWPLHAPACGEWQCLDGGG